MHLCMRPVSSPLCIKAAQLCRESFFLSEIFFRQFHPLTPDCPACPAPMLQAALLYTQFRQEDFDLTAQFS